MAQLPKLTLKAVRDPRQLLSLLQAQEARICSIEAGLESMRVKNAKTASAKSAPKKTGGAE